MSYQFAWEDPAAKDSYDPEYVEFLVNDYLPNTKKILEENKEELDKIDHIVLKLRAQRKLTTKLRLNSYLPIDSFKDEVIVTDETFPSIDGYEVPIKVYKPKDVGAFNAVYINFHGGGFVLGGLYNDLKQNYWLVHLTGITVIDIDYRLVPEWTYSTAFYDSYAAIKYVKENADRFGIDAKRVAIGGTSAGAKISIAAAHVSRDLKIPVDLVIANVPPVENSLGFTKPEDSQFPGSFTKFDKDPFLNFGRVSLFEAASAEAEKTSPRIDPKLIKEFFKDVPELEIYERSILDATNYTSLPKHIIYVGEHDILSDGGKGYAKKLIDNGIEVTFRTARGLGHSHAVWNNQFKESKKYLDLVVNELRRLQAGDYSK